MGEFEHKFIYDNMLASALEGWLRFHCLPDEEYPAARVHTVYFDSITLRSLGEKRNSDYFKTKYRIRWYEPLGKNSTAAKGQDTPIFIEVKRKIGAQRRKHRMLSTAAYNELRWSALDTPFFQNLSLQFLEEGEGGDIQLLPLIHLSYTRKRFNEPLQGARLSLDHDISLERTNYLLLPPACAQRLPDGVFEVKWDDDSMPHSLEYLTSHWLKKCAFSKFERCVSLVTTSP